jgi:SAM-dependent methyltransferase
MPALDYSLLSDVYDKFVKTDLDVEFFLKESEGMTDGVLELMCGTGRLSIPLLAGGIPLTCVDSSPEMLTHLRRKLAESNYSAEVVEQDIVRLSLPRKYDLALVPFNSFSEIIAVQDQLGALESIHRCLRVNGKVIVTLHNPDVRLKRINGLPFDMGPFPLDEKGNTLTVTLIETFDPVARLVTGHEVLMAFDTTDELLWKRDIPMRFRLPSLADLEDLARNAGFTIDALYGDYNRSPYVSNVSPFIIGTLRA